MLWLAVPALADSHDVRRVLVVDTERADRPLWIEIASVFRPALREQCRQPVDVYYESIDLARFGGEDHLSRFQSWLDVKYRDRPPDVVVAAGPLTYHLMAGWIEHLPADTPLVLAAVDEATAAEARRRHRATALVYEFRHADTVRIALELLPDTRSLAMVGGAKDSDPHSRYFYDRIAADFEGRLEMIDLCGLPTGELKRRVADLPDDTILLLTSVFVDGDGRPTSQPEMIAELAPVANAPFFSSVSTELGSGAVGGALLDGSTFGRELAALVARVLNGEVAESIPPVRSRADVVAFDWRQLQRWRMSPRRLPAGSIVRFRPPSLWEQHRSAVLVALAVFVLQGASIVALLRSRQRRRAVNRALHRFSGRLLTAQEDERKRVARDLHDDVSQRLALLAIELETEPDIPDERRVQLSSSVQALAGDVHAIAHDLQPPRLEGHGLTAELETFCRQVATRHGVAIDVRPPARPVPVPAQAALALYRVAQEAIQNAVKHGGADEIAVEVAVSPRWASVTVADNGRGFRVDPRGDSHGLGLPGMRERVLLLGGWLDLASEPGSGTTVSAWIPLGELRRSEADNEPATSPDR